MPSAVMMSGESVWPASMRPSSTIADSRLRLMGSNAFRLRFVKPNLGTRRWSGIWPPSNHVGTPPPERDFWPLWPRPTGWLPWPEPWPRPTRFLVWVEPLAGVSLLRSISLGVLETPAGADSRGAGDTPARRLRGRLKKIGRPDSVPGRPRFRNR